MSAQLTSRRTMLRGLGVSMALPWMESLRVWGQEAGTTAATGQAPTRFAVLFSGNGFHKGIPVHFQGAFHKKRKIYGCVVKILKKTAAINGFY